MRRRGVVHIRALRRRPRLAPGLALALACAVLLLTACMGDSSSDESGDEEMSADPGKTRVLENRAFRCTGPVDLDLVRVTMRTPVQDAISLATNCTGRIGRIEVETWTADGIKVQNQGDVAHDLVIESGYVKCHEVAGEYHQDGIQVMGGSAITFRNLRVDCLGNSNFFLAKGGQGASLPTDIVCEGCILGPNTAQTLFYADSLRSGARDTTVCEGRFRAIRIEPEAEELVRSDVRVLPRDDPSCADVTGTGAR